MSQHTILSIGGKEEVCRNLVELGADILLVQTPARAEEQAEALLQSRWALLVDYENEPALLTALVREFHRQHPLSACMSFAEQGLLIAAGICEELRLPGMPPVSAVKHTRDKLRMREILAQGGYSTVRARLGRSSSDLGQFAKESGFPVIIKPREGVGSFGVHLVSSQADLRLGDQYEIFLMEEFLSGREFSVESYSRDGRHWVIGATEKTINSAGIGNPFLEIAHRFPAELSPETYLELCQFVEQVLTLLGVTEGPAHTEVKLTPSGFQIVETQTRFGGDCITDLVRIVTGHDLIAMSVAGAAGLSHKIPNQARLAGGAAIRYFLPKPGIVKRISGLDEASEQPGVHRIHLPLAIGDRVVAPQLAYDRVGYIIATGNTSREAAQRCEDICQLVVIDTE